ncbi:hypothetical protein [Jiangella muralis]|uniref:hypothetical protein n=1 Tax=Jiangella muralis TaxID=702383 RepID=UPI00069E9F04|nr:hypothetical protein [Jiangella muralis]
MAEGQPWGATVDGVAALLPDAPLLESAPVNPQPGQKIVTRATVQEWVDQFCAKVALRLDGWEALRDDSRREYVKLTACDLVHNAAGSYAQAARFPERAGKATDSYSGILWDRYTTGLDALAKLVEEWTQDPDESADPTSDRPAWSFPPVTFYDGIRW